MQELAGRNIHQQDAVLIAMLVNAVHIATLDRYGRDAEIERHTQKFVQLLCILVDSFYPARLVGYANS